MRKLPGKSSITILLASLFLFYSYYVPVPEEFNERVNSFYSKNLSELKKEIGIISQLCLQKNKTILQKQFVIVRNIYKKAAVLLEYFNPYEAKFLNGPNLKRIESETPDNIIEPSGFQVIEDILYNKNSSIDYENIVAQTDIMIQKIERIETESGRINKFREDLVFNALQSQLISIVALGITGYDSPIAFHSIDEASSSFEGIRLVLFMFKNDIEKINCNLINRLNAEISDCKQYLSLHPGFNSFDRIKFITAYINPLAALITSTGKKLNLVSFFPNRPVNGTISTIFSHNVFNVDFFSPGPPYEKNFKRIQLGKQLFSDPLLSGNKKKSCASCHKPEKAFTDGLKTALSINDTSYLVRNTPTLWNAALQTKFFWDSRTGLLENQLDEVVHNEKEMKGSLKQSVQQLKSDAAYSSLFKDAYPGEKDAVVEFNIANAISSYVRSLVALNSRFDKYMRGNTTALSAQEKNGFNLFAGKGKCATCHFIPLFNGLVPPFFSDTESEILGVPATKDKKKAVLDPDIGRTGFTTSIIHRFAFKTPTLRNIALTAPYMHNGVYTTLDEVVDFYNEGGGKGLKIAPKNQSLPFDKLNLSGKEKADIISFMKSLTDTVYKKIN